MARGLGRDSAGDAAMSPQQKRQVTVGVLTTIIGAAFLGLMGWANATVIFRPEFALHESRVEAKLDRVLDIVCADKPTLRQCQ